MAVATKFERELEQAKATQTLQLLFRVARLVNDRAVAHVRGTRPWAAGFRAAHTALFPHIDLQGTRLTALARRLGISKQAVAQLVDELVEAQVLERRPDPEDGRAKLICFSSRGRRAILDGLEALNEVQRELEDHVGRRRMSSLHDTLSKILEVVEAPRE